MAQTFDSISERLREFIEAQHLFFVASAPLAAEGHVNLSPKGMESLRVLSENQVAYLDLTGSGNETSAHLLENGRITLMFCAFEGAPQILRLYGVGRTVLPGSAEWEQLSPKFTLYTGARQIIVVDVQRVHTSCGYAVPLFDFVGQRDTLVRWAEAKGEDELESYKRQKNAASIDCLPTPWALNTISGSD